MADEDEDIAALVVDNGSGMCKGAFTWLFLAVVNMMKAAADDGRSTTRNNANCGCSVRRMRDLVSCHA